MISDQQSPVKYSASPNVKYRPYGRCEIFAFGKCDLYFESPFYCIMIYSRSPQWRTVVFIWTHIMIPYKGVKQYNCSLLIVNCKGKKFSERKPFFFFLRLIDGTCNKRCTGRLFGKRTRRPNTMKGKRCRGCFDVSSRNQADREVVIPHRLVLHGQQRGC